MVAAVTGFPARSRRRPKGVPAASRRYERRRPEKTPLHRVVSENLESWLKWREAAERPVPGYVEDELRGYLECGLLCFSLRPASLHDMPHGIRGGGPAEPGSAAMGTLGVPIGCPAGRGHGRPALPMASCKGRGVCPSCNGRHMAQTAAHLADHVIPPVPVRQWVISVPKRLRGMLADRPPAVAALMKIFLTEIERLLHAAAGFNPAANTPASARPRLGGISPATASARRSTATCTCGTRVTDGVFVPAAAEAGGDTPPTFLPSKGKRQKGQAPFADTNGASPCRGRRRHARLADQRVFSRRERPDHTHRPRCAQLFSESRASSPILCPAALRTQAALRGGKGASHQIWAIYRNEKWCQPPFGPTIWIWCPVDRLFGGG